MVKYITSIFLFILACIFPNEKCWGQCDYYQINHLSGTANVGGCTNVTVTPEGSTSTFTGCGYSPYWIGENTSGAILFQFSQPIEEARISLAVLDHQTAPVYQEEVVSFEVNGTPYPLTTPGTYQAGCVNNSLFINADGNIASTADDSGSWENIVITETMNSLKIADTWLAGSPDGVVVRVEICCQALNCTTEAGMFTASSIEVCEDEPAIFAPPVQTVLDSDDLLEYILFSDLLDTLGSIIATSLNPQFSFDPSTMQTGVTYYIAALAGNNWGGAVDPADPCLDISNVIEVIWHPLPTVSFSVPSPDVCVGNCIDVEVSFTGSPPFQLSVEALSGTMVVFTASETYMSNIAILPICVPSGTSIGDLTVTATGLTDNFCTCN